MFLEKCSPTNSTHFTTLYNDDLVIILPLFALKLGPIPYRSLTKKREPSSSLTAEETKKLCIALLHKNNNQ